MVFMDTVSTPIRAVRCAAMLSEEIKAPDNWVTFSFMITSKVPLPFTTTCRSMSSRVNSVKWSWFSPVGRVMR